MDGRSVDQERIAALERELEQRDKKIEKLKKYVTNLESDGDRLVNQLAVANSYRKCFDRMSSPWFMVDANLKVQDANGPFLDIVGVGREVVESGTCCCDDLMPTQRGLLHDCMEQKRSLIDVPSRYLSKAGRRFDLLVDAIPIQNVSTASTLGALLICTRAVEDTSMKMLTFLVGDIEFCIDVERLQSIVHVDELTRMAGASPFVRGIVNHQGKVIAVVDVSAKLGLGPTRITDRTSCLLVESRQDGERRTWGLMVGEVSAIASTHSTKIEKIASLTRHGAVAYVGGFITIERSTRIVLDVDRLFSGEEHQHFRTLAA
jgi:purine-binding chemotaxis protein CheW